LALIGAAQVAASEHMFGSRGAVGIGAQTHTGRALVVDDPSVALDLIEPGDVVVTRATSPAWNAVLGQAGALVTSAGGLVCHAALLARELDIPAVIGDHTAMERFRTGDVVTVDPVGVVAHHALPAVRFGPG
jgi:pyruvate,water dikinase